LFSINIPLWHEKYASGVREARRRHMAAMQQRREKANSLSSRLKMALYGFRDAERKISSFTDLIDAQRILLEFALSYERALADKYQSLAELEMLVGRRIPPKANRTARTDVTNSRLRANSQGLER